MIPERAVIGENESVPSCGPVPVVQHDPSRIVMDTRFGLMEFSNEHAIYMPRGMMGFSDNKKFGLAQIPDPRMESFLFLQSLMEPELSFILMPMDPNGELIEKRDIEAVRESLSIEPQDLAVLSVVSIRNVGGSTQVSINLRAPVFIDVGNRSAWQHVLSNGRYPIRYILETVQNASS